MTAPQPRQRDHAPRRSNYRARIGTAAAGLIAAALGAGLASCEQHVAKSTDPYSTAEKHPEPATRPSSAPASGVIEAPFAAVIPEDSQKKPTAGAESSGSNGAGPSNGSAAVGGKTQQ